MKYNTGLPKKISNMYKNWCVNMELLTLHPPIQENFPEVWAALIRTLALKPEFLLLDEPFSALDYQTRLDVSDDIAKIIRQSGVTTLLVTHDLSEAISIADRIIVLGKRPGHIRKIVTIDFKTNKKLSSKEARIHPKFQEYFNQIWKELKADEWNFKRTASIYEKNKTT